MYGKIFETMYTGSMVGKGSPMFAVWGYVIANMKPERIVTDAGTGKKVSFGAQVELNSGLLAYILGEKQEVVERVIKQLCMPDPKSRTKEEEGRRLVQVGEYAYRVVNGEHYRKLRNAEERREYQRVKQAEYRAKKKGGGSGALPGENVFLKTGEMPHEYQYLEEKTDDKKPKSKRGRGPRASEVSGEEQSGVEGTVRGAQGGSGPGAGRVDNRNGSESEMGCGEEEAEATAQEGIEPGDEAF